MAQLIGSGPKDSPDELRTLLKRNFLKRLTGTGGGMERNASAPATMNAGKQKAKAGASKQTSTRSTRGAR